MNVESFAFLSFNILLSQSGCLQTYFKADSLVLLVYCSILFHAFCWNVGIFIWKGIYEKNISVPSFLCSLRHANVLVNLEKNQNISLYNLTEFFFSEKYW